MPEQSSSPNIEIMAKIVVDPDAWLTEWGAGSTRAEVGDDARSYVLHVLQGVGGPFVSIKVI